MSAVRDIAVRRREASSITQRHRNSAPGGGRGPAHRSESAARLRRQTAAMMPDGNWKRGRLKPQKLGSRRTVLEVTRLHFSRAAREIGQSGENDTLPYDVDASFIRDKAEELSTICIQLFDSIETKPLE